MCKRKFHLQIRKRANNNDIKTEIELTAFREHCAYNSIQYDNTRHFHSTNETNSWSCFEFKNHLIIPTHYTIRPYSGGGYQPIHHKVEVANDKYHWEVIHEEKGHVFPSGNRVTSLFSIAEKKPNSFELLKLAKIHQTIIISQLIPLNFMDILNNSNTNSCCSMTCHKYY